MCMQHIYAVCLWCKMRVNHRKREAHACKRRYGFLSGFYTEFRHTKFHPKKSHKSRTQRNVLEMCIASTIAYEGEGYVGWRYNIFTLDVSTNCAFSQVKLSFFPCFNNFGSDNPHTKTTYEKFFDIKHLRPWMLYEKQYLTGCMYRVNLCHVVERVQNHFRHFALVLICTLLCKLRHQPKLQQQLRTRRRFGRSLYRSMRVQSYNRCLCMQGWKEATKNVNVVWLLGWGKIWEISQLVA